MGVKRDRESADMSNDTDVITEDEAALYDRQIRLWGLDCQKRIREAKILIIGLNGLGAEVVKNLTLSGVKSITIMDETPVSETDYSAQFFVVGAVPGEGRATASKAAIQELNPNVEIVIDSDPLCTKHPLFFADFSAVFATDCPLSLLIRINKACHEYKILFYCGDCWGFYGFGFLDLQKHKYSKVVHKNGKKEETKETNVFEVLDFCPLGPALGVKVGSGLNRKINKVYILLNILNNFRETHDRLPSTECRDSDITLLKNVRSFTAQNLGCDESKVSDEILSLVFGELSPVCAAVGGILSNEIIKGISRKGEPLYNFLLFDGVDCNGVVETVIVRD